LKVGVTQTGAVSAAGVVVAGEASNNALNVGPQLHVVGKIVGAGVGDGGVLLVEIVREEDCTVALDDAIGGGCGGLFGASLLWRRGLGSRVSGLFSQLQRLGVSRGFSVSLAAAGDEGAALALGGGEAEGPALSIGAVDAVGGGGDLAVGTGEFTMLAQDEVERAKELGVAPAAHQAGH